MLGDKTLFYYGPVYHWLFDAQQAEARQIAVDLVEEGASVLDVACGTGQLCLALSEQKQCQVVGVDLSLRMLKFARRSNRYEDVAFIHADATSLADFGDGYFDVATMVMVMHELSGEQQSRALGEALRVAAKVIIIDSAVPLPRNARGIGTRLVEATLGRKHHLSFRAFLDAGGIHGVLHRLDLPVTVEHDRVFWKRCREVVVVSTSR